MTSSKALKQLLVVVSASFLTSITALSAVIGATASDQRPSGEILVDTNAFNTSLAWNGISTTIANNYRDVGQIFRAPTSANMEAVSFKIHIVGANAGDAEFSLSLYEVASRTATPASEPLYTGVGALPSLMEVNDWLTFTFDTPQQLTAGKYYAVQLSFVELGEEVKLNLYADGTGAYADGRAFFYSNEQPGPERVYSARSAQFGMLVIIPEQRTYALLLVGCAALFIPLRHRFSRRTITSG